MGPRAPGRQRHRRRLQRRTLLRRRRGALLLRRHVSDAEPDRRQGHHRHRRLRVTPAAPALLSPAPVDAGDMNMASPTATVTPSPAVVPTASPALTLANVLYEKKDAIAYVTVNR